jgi:dolichol-phosphate mannosyltransferase
MMQALMSEPAAPQNPPYLSLVVPVYNEQECLPELLRRASAALAGAGSFEIIIVDDGSTDGTADLLRQALSRSPWLRVLRLTRNSGQSAAYDAGFKTARGQVIVTLDGDLQNDPEEIPRLLTMLDAYDMISGWRRDRQDSFWRRWQSAVANRVRNRVTRETIRDSACSLKVYRRHCLAGLQMYRGMHRFLPTLVKMRGYRVLETPVKHSPRLAGQTKYGLRRRLLGPAMDLLAVRWMQKRWLRYEVREVGAMEEQEGVRK